MTATGAELLVLAADLLPGVVERGPFLSGDVHTALHRAACELWQASDYAGVWRLADEAADMFAVFLAIVGQANRREPVTQALRCLAGEDTRTVGWMLRVAGEFWHHELTGTRADRRAPPTPVLATA